MLFGKNSINLLVLTGTSIGFWTKSNKGLTPPVEALWTANVVHKCVTQNASRRPTYSRIQTKDLDRIWESASDKLRQSNCK